MLLNQMRFYREDYLLRQPAVKTFEESCELCIATVGNPIITHLRNNHPGCGTPTLSGFDVNGNYNEGDARLFSNSQFTHCGAYGREAITGFWYMFCPDCQYETLRRYRPWSLDLLKKSINIGDAVNDDTTIFGKYDYCLLCGINVSLLIVSHLRSKHPGCSTPTLCGYNKHGNYKIGTAAQFRAMKFTTCGSFGEEKYTGIWYMYCPDCRGNIMTLRSRIPKIANPPISYDFGNICY